jgi:hypothetical protein
VVIAKPRSTLALPGNAVNGFTVPVVSSEPGVPLEAYIVGSNAANPAASPFRVIDVNTGEIKADVDLAGAQLGNVSANPQSVHSVHDCRHLVVACCQIVVSGTTKSVIASSNDPNRVGIVRLYRLPLTGVLAMLFDTHHHSSNWHVNVRRILRFCCPFVTNHPPRCVTR